MNLGRASKSLLLGAVVAVAHALAQVPVPVRDEPKHKVTLENDYVRVIDVRFSPGETTLYHVHAIPSVVVELADATIRSQEMGKPPADARHVKPGETRYAPYDETPLTHKVTNEGKSVFHVLDIELVRPKKNEAWTPTSPPTGATMEWEQKMVRTYQGRVEAAQRCAIPPDDRARLLIGISGTAKTTARTGRLESEKKLSPEEFLYFPPRSTIQITAGATAATYVLLELR